MKRFNNNVVASLLAAAALALASPAAFAQATRTWVSGVGDDANPCSRTAPCKTFAGAISKTAAGGLINVLDPGGFGGVTITKAITIDGASIGHGGVLVSGTNGIIINAPATANVVIRNMNIIGVGTTDLAGIRFLAGRSLTVDNVSIQGFDRHGIEFQPTATSFLSITDTFLHQNYGASYFGGGIWIAPTGAGRATAQINRLTSTDNGYGIRVSGRSIVAMRNSVISGNGTHGLSVFSAVEGGGTDFAIATVQDSQFANNGHSGTGTAVYANGSLAEITLSNSDVTHNDYGLRVVGGAALRSWGNNRVFDNDSSDPFTQTLTPN